MRREGALAVLVGEQNPYGDDPRTPLFPSPEGSAGWRLCCLVLCMGRAAYLRSFHRYNLLGRGRWSSSAARDSALKLLDEYSAPVPLVLLGRRVADAFGFTDHHAPPCWGARKSLDSSFRDVVLLPHPSGRSRSWNVPGAAERARELVREVLGGAA